MPDLADLIPAHPFASEYLMPALDYWSRTSRILILVDGTIRFGNAAFSLRRVAAALRAFRPGLARFELTLATRNGPAGKTANPGPEDFHYTGFRFDGTAGNPSLDHYDQIWLFGYWPGNDGFPGAPNDPSSLDPALNQLIGHPSANPLGAVELQLLVSWMNGGGGLFATGDHQMLGASMCAYIPRVNTMRRWRITPELPTFDGPQRFDTTRPATPEQAAGTEVIWTDVETDATAQPIRWVPFRDDPRSHGGHPHPILTHPRFGPIDVLPDHPHEGHCYDTGTPEWLAAHGGDVYTIGRLHGPHYPTVSGMRPLPVVLAHGDTLAGPPLDFDKGPQPFRRVPLIVAYDGQAIDIGRVVVDATWHHWFDMNLDGLAAAPDQTPYQKIERYYLNVAIWLAQPGYRAAMVMGGLKAEQFDYFGTQEFALAAEPMAMGKAVLRHFGRTLGEGWLRAFAREAAGALVPGLETRLGGDKAGKKGRDALDEVELAVLGEMAKAAYADQREAMAELAKKGRIGKPRDFQRDPLLLAARAARLGLSAVEARWRGRNDRSASELKAFRRDPK